MSDPRRAATAPADTGPESKNRVCSWKPTGQWFQISYSTSPTPPYLHPFESLSGQTFSVSFCGQVDRWSQTAAVTQCPSCQDVELTETSSSVGETTWQVCLMYSILGYIFCRIFCRATAFHGLVRRKIKLRSDAFQVSSYIHIHCLVPSLSPVPGNHTRLTRHFDMDINPLNLIKA